MEDALQPTVRSIHEGLFNRRAGDLVADFDFDFVVADGQRDFAVIDFHDERADRFVGRGSFEAEQPQRFFLFDFQIAFTIDDENRRVIAFRASRFARRHVDFDAGFLSADNLEFAVVNPQCSW